MINKTVLENAKLNIAKKRQVAENSAAKAMEQAKKIDGFSALYARYASLNGKIGFAEFRGEDTAPLLSEKRKLSGCLSELLADSGLSVADLSPAYSCKTCLDTGVIFGEPCKCLTAEYERLLSRAQGQSEYDAPDVEHVSFEIYSDEYRAKYRALFATLAKIVSTFPSCNNRYITLFGAVASGKTFISQAAAKSFSNRGIDVKFISAFALNNNFLKFHTTFDESKLFFFEPFIEAPVLIIDDLGTEPVYSNVTVEYLFRLISERNQNGKITFISTNLSEADFTKRYGERTTSRLFDKYHGSKIFLFGKDLRQ